MLLDENFLLIIPIGGGLLGNTLIGDMRVIVPLGDESLFNTSTLRLPLADMRVIVPLGGESLFNTSTLRLPLADVLVFAPPGGNSFGISKDSGLLIPLLIHLKLKKR